MSAERHDRVKELFLAVADLPAEERASFLDGACAGDPDLRAEVERLVAFEESVPGFLEPGGVQEESAGPRRALARLEERRGGAARYEIQDEVARGGMGAILRVHDRDLRRTLAMKVMLAGSPVSRDERTLARFLEEAQVTGQLDHPGIVPVHELGLDEQDRPYFTMKLVKGRDLKEVFELARTGAEGWTQARVLGVILKVCEAMAYAHSKRVIHRDLKPTNVMVGRFGEVYVMDWGLARVIGQRDALDVRLRPADDGTLSRVRTDRRDDSGPDSPLETMDGDVVGTPAYMSPEQARGDIEAMGAASDVYSLGAILYQLLAGHMPYVRPGARLGAHAVWALVQQGPPAPLAEVASDAPEELVAICEKAMSRAPAERYPDTGAMAEDLRAYVEGRVVRAHRTGAVAELRKWVGRNQGLAGAVAAAAVLLVVGTVTSASLYVRSEAKATEASENETAARDAEARAGIAATRAGEEAARANAEADRANDAARRAELAAEEARQASYVASFRAATISFEAGSLSATRSALLGCAAELRGWEWHRLALLERLARRGWGRPALVTREPERITALAFAPDDARFATASGAPTVRVWDAVTGQPLLALEGHASEVLALAFDPGGTSLASASADGTVRVWDVASGTCRAVLAGHGAPVACVAYARDGARLVSGSEDGTARVWDAATGAALATFPGHEGGVRALAPLTGARLATLSRGDVLRVWGVERRALLDTRQAKVFAAAAVAPSLAYADGEGLHVYDPESGAVERTLTTDVEEVCAVALAPDGSRLVSAAWDGSLRLWDPATGAALSARDGHQEYVGAIGFSADGSAFVTGSWDRTVMLWRASDGALLRVLPAHPRLPAHPGWVTAVAIDSIGSRVLSASGAEARMWDGVWGEATVTWPGHARAVSALTFTQDGASLASVADDGEAPLALWGAIAAEPVPLPSVDDCRDPFVQLCAARTGATLACVHGHDPAVASVSADGSRVAAACARVSAGLCVWDRATGQLLHNLQPEESGWSNRVVSVALSPDGTSVAGVSTSGSLSIWETASGALRGTVQEQGLAFSAVAYHPGGARLVTLTTDGAVDLRDAQRGGLVRVLAGATTVAPPGASDGRDPRQPRGLAAPPVLAYRADGSRLVVGLADGALRLWNGATDELLAVLEGHLGPVTAVTFSPDGRRIASASLDDTVRLWDADSGEALAVLEGYAPPPPPATPMDLAEDPGADADQPLAAGSLAAGSLADWQSAMDAPAATPAGITAVCFSPDGSRITAGHLDGTLRTWLTDPGEARAVWLVRER